MPQASWVILRAIGLLTVHTPFIICLEVEVSFFFCFGTMHAGWVKNKTHKPQADEIRCIFTLRFLRGLRRLRPRRPRRRVLPPIFLNEKEPGLLFPMLLNEKDPAMGVLEIGLMEIQHT